MSAAEVLRRITAALDRAGIAYMLTGSFASAHHGVPRSTLDIDIVIAADPEQLRTFVESLPGGEYYADLNARQVCCILDFEAGKVEFFSASTSLISDAECFTLA